MLLPFLLLLFHPPLFLCEERFSFKYSEVIEPRIDCFDSECNAIDVTFVAFNRNFSLKVKRNDELLKNSSSSTIDLKSHCHYITSNRSDEKWAALSVCRGQLSGLFDDRNDLFHIHFDETKNVTLIFRDSDLKQGKLSCDVGSTDHVRPKRSSVRGFSVINSDTRFVELVLVNDNRVFKANSKDNTRLIEENQKIANIINAFYRQLNVIVVLVDVVIWSKFDEIMITSNTNKTLREFLNYREKNLVPKIKHDNAQLITGVKFEGDIVGKAIKGSICDPKNSGGINYYHSKVISLIATTIAHEMGHNFGMEHDHSECVCPSRGACIMAESVGSVSPTQWSSCSIKLMMLVFSRPNLQCLRDEPPDDVGSNCGNGVLEAGEECDCDQEICSHCCDRKTCRLKPEAECGTGICCDLNSCKVIRERVVCRQPRSECDITERCDGKSEFCPSDVLIHDGYKCKGGFCYKGQCNNNEKQCKLLWGLEAKVAFDTCFNGNIRGKSDGNCGFDHRRNVFIPCEAKDTKCGLLQCFTPSQILKYDGDYVSATLSSRKVLVKGEWIECHSTIIKNGPNQLNPGLVSDGNTCGEDMLCVNQRCLNVSVVLNVNKCPKECSNNGVCGNNGVCYCNDGFVAPYCEKESSSAFGVVILVLVIIILLCAISFFVYIKYIKKRRPKKPTLTPKRKRNLTSLNGRALHISPPTNIVTNPMSQVNTISSNVPEAPPKRPVRRAPPPPCSTTTASKAFESCNGNVQMNGSKSIKSSRVNQLKQRFEECS